MLRVWGLGKLPFLQPHLWDDFCNQQQRGNAVQNHMLLKMIFFPVIMSWVLY